MESAAAAQTIVVASVTEAPAEAPAAELAEAPAAALAEALRYGSIGAIY